MSWLFSQVLVEEFLPDTYSDGEPSAPSNGNPTQLAYLPPDRMTAFSRLSRFGMTFRPLTADRGEALLMSYLAAFLVKTSPQQEGEPESKVSDLECGERWHGWLAKFDPDTSTLRTAQCSLLEEEHELLQTLPRSGMTRSGMLWERQTLVLRISETESGLLPNGETFFHTPNTTGMDGGSNSRKALKKRKYQWPTPCLPGNGGTNGKAKLKEMLKWPTPVCQDSRHAISRHLDPNNEKWKSNLGEVVMSLEPTSNGRLNPTWVEWLMGWPLGWTDLKPLEMAKFQEWQQQHLDC